MSGLGPEQLVDFLRREFPVAAEQGFVIDRADAEGVTLRLPADDRHLRPGGTVMGPTLMMLADTAAYLAILARVGHATMAVTTSLEIHFLKRAAPGELVTDATLLKLGKRLAVAVADVRDGSGEVVAHATVTYALP